MGNACEGANGNNNDLAAHYERLVDEEKISEEKQTSFEKIVVGKTYCPEAIESFLNEKGLVPKPIPVRILTSKRTTAVGSTKRRKATSARGGPRNAITSTVTPRTSIPMMD